MKKVTTLAIVSVILTACGPGQLLGPTVTPTLTATATPSPTATATATSTPTPTPIALTAEQALGALLSLTELEPGYTTILEAQQMPEDFSNFATANPKIQAYLQDIGNVHGYQVQYQQKTLTGCTTLSRIYVFPNDEAASNYLADYPQLLTPGSSAISFESFSEESIALLLPRETSGYKFDDYIVLQRRHNVIGQITDTWSSGLGNIDLLENHVTIMEDHLRAIAP